MIIKRKTFRTWWPKIRETVLRLIAHIKLRRMQHFVQFLKKKNQRRLVMNSNHWLQLMFLIRFSQCLPFDGIQ